MDDTWAIRENLRRFRDLLKNEKDEAKRRTLEKLNDALANRAGTEPLDMPPKVRALLVRTWRLTSHQFAVAATGTGDGDIKRRLANRALDLAQQAEALERRSNHGLSAVFSRIKRN